MAAIVASVCASSTRSALPPWSLTNRRPPWTITPNGSTPASPIASTRLRSTSTRAMRPSPHGTKAIRPPAATVRGCSQTSISANESELTTDSELESSLAVSTRWSDMTAMVELRSGRSMFVARTARKAHAASAAREARFMRK
jgi:hypothetical protein